MKRKQKKVFFFAGILFLGFVLLFPFVPKRHEVNRQVCIDCGVARDLEIREIAYVINVRKNSVESTAVSQTIDLKGCEHQWLTFRQYGSHGRLIGGWLESGGGSRTIMIHSLLNDDHFAQELAELSDPGETWRTLVLKIDENEDFDQELARWWDRGLERGSFASWWTDRRMDRLGDP